MNAHLNCKNDSCPTHTRKTRRRNGTYSGHLTAVHETSQVGTNAA